jgi:UDP-3-O-[3-hydroxymyristoyl] glucosamine N-acyltransferase
MEYSVKALAQFLNAEISGDPETKVHTVSKIEEGFPGALCFLANPQYEKYLYTTKASAVIVARDFNPSAPVIPVLLKVDHPYQAFATLLEMVKKAQVPAPGIEEPVKIHNTATLGKNISVGAFSYVSAGVVLSDNVVLYPGVFIGINAKIGANTVLHPGVKVLSDCVVGANCMIHANSVIGSDGFGFAPQEGADYKKVPQVGNVVIEDHVEIGANTTIDRATMGSTRIGKGVKLDNLIQIAHNVEVGENTVIAAQAGVSGSTKVGKFCMIGGQVGLSGHLTIADKVKIAAQSGIGKSITTEGEIVQGSPAFGIRDYQRAYVVFRNLPELSREVAEIRKELDRK